jgi:hypothetical protein
MTDQPKPDKPVTPTKLSSMGLTIPADWVEVFGGAPFAIVGADHLRPRAPKDEAPAPSPAPAPDAPERK